MQLQPCLGVETSSTLVDRLRALVQEAVAPVDVVVPDQRVDMTSKVVTTTLNTCKQSL